MPGAIGIELGSHVLELARELVREVAAVVEDVVGREVEAVLVVEQAFETVAAQSETAPWVEVGSEEGLEVGHGALGGPQLRRRGEVGEKARGAVGATQRDLDKLERHELGAQVGAGLPQETGDCGEAGSECRFAFGGACQYLQAVQRFVQVKRGVTLPAAPIVHDLEAGQLAEQHTAVDAFVGAQGRGNQLLQLGPRSGEPGATLGQTILAEVGDTRVIVSNAGRVASTGLRRQKASRNAENVRRKRWCRRA